MTDIAATGGHGHRTVDRRQAGSDPRGGPRFADLLLGRALSGDGHPFGSGTMRSNVEAFGAHGFFDGSVPVAGSTEAVPQAEARPTADDCDPRAAADGGETGPIIPEPTRSGSGPAPGRSPGCAPPPADAERSPAFVAVPQEIQPSVPEPFAAAAVATDGEMEPVPPARPVAPRARATQAAATLKVSLAADGAGAAVSVLGDVRETRLHQAVSRLLARHGLVLRGLRVTRIPSAAGRQQG